MITRLKKRMRVEEQQQKKSNGQKKRSGENTNISLDTLERIN